MNINATIPGTRAGTAIDVDLVLDLAAIGADIGRVEIRFPRIEPVTVSLGDLIREAQGLAKFVPETPQQAEPDPAAPQATPDAPAAA